MVVNADVRYPSLFLALASWTERVLPLLHSRMEQRPLETRDASIWAPRLVSEAFNPKSPIRMLPETRELGGAVAGMPQFSEDSVSNEDWHSNPLLPPIQASLKFGYFLHAYLGDELDWSFNRRRFERVYRDLESLLDDPGAISITVRVELWNLRSTRRKIQLAEGIAIRPLTATERKRHIAASRSAGRFGPPEYFDHFKWDPPVPALYLELTRNAQAYEAPGLPLQQAIHFGIAEDVRCAAHDTLLGLRLLAAGDFGIGWYEVVTGNRLLRVDGATTLSVAINWPSSRAKHPRRDWQRPMRRETLNSAWGSYTDQTPFGPKVEISAAMATALQQLWPLLQQDMHKDLVPAFHRFELSFDRTGPEDRLIDYWVALEALFLPDVKLELGRAASQRLAYYIEGNSEQRLKTYKITKKSYGYRSDIVHGNSYDPAEVEESATTILAHLRRALLKSLDQNRRPDTVALDNAMMFRP